MAMVDVIIPAFNAARYLEAALESVLSQSFDDWRILLVDDGSTDNIAEVIAPFLQRLGPKLTYIHHVNRGLSAARNTAIAASTAEFLALLDADDVWLPCRLAESVKVLRERPQAGLSYGLFQSIDQDGQPGNIWAGNHTVVEGRIAPYIYMRTVELPCPTITIRRSCLDVVGVFDETMRATEDRDLWLRIALRYEVACVPKVIAYYRSSPNSLTSDAARMLRAQLQFINKNYGSKGCGWRARQAAMARCHKQQAEHLKTQGRAAAALRSAFLALSLYPASMDNLRTTASLFVHWSKSLMRSHDLNRSKGA